VGLEKRGVSETGQFPVRQSFSCVEGAIDFDKGRSNLQVVAHCSEIICECGREYKHIRRIST
jgi:hypothetical protein